MKCKLNSKQSVNGTKAANIKINICLHSLEEHEDLGRPRSKLHD
jgi:hypothetical protein